MDGRGGGEAQRVADPPIFFFYFDLKKTLKPSTLLAL
jgi:hypothetical protein